MDSFLATLKSAGYGLTAFPVMGYATLGGVLLLLAGVLVITRGRDWPGKSSRYEAPTGRRVVAPGAAAKRTAGTEPSSPNDLWKALDRGEDPTA